MEEEIIVIGHKNPDTDSIVSAIVYASLKTKLGFKAAPKRAGKANKETDFVLSYFNEPLPEIIDSLSGKKVILVDHSDPSQAAEGFTEAELLEIIDHHYIGGIKTEKPIYYRAEPVGSTSTIIAKIFKEKGIEISKKEARLLCASIISDTLMLNSPTATGEDKEILSELAKMAGLDVKDLSLKMFDAKSDLTGVSIEEIISGDAKEFQFSQTKFGIAIFETTMAKKVKDFGKENIIKAMDDYKKKQGEELLFFLTVDILKNNSFLYIIGPREAEVAEQAFSGKIQDNVMFLEGVVSRKKQVLPKIVEALEKIKKQK